jgi:serine/threonine-protein kinase
MAGTELVGCTLGRYLVECEIGRGGTSVVYRAWDLVRRRAVALKIAGPGSNHDSPPVDLVREGRWLTRCRAPHVVQVFEVGRHDAAEFIAMELMASTLEVRKADGPVSGKELIGIGTGMLLGLDAAHREGIFHGDIKPANVGISLRGTVKLLDFGIARPLPGFALDQLITTALPIGGIVGTVPYMAPEQLLGNESDECADIYAVGAVLFELATGRPPFCEDSFVAIIDAVLNSDPPRPSSLNLSVESDTDDLLMKALAKAPSERFQSAQEMLDALLQTGAAQREALSAGLLPRKLLQPLAPVLASTAL